MAEAVYVLSALTSLACALLLFRGYKRSRLTLLLWSSLCFVGLTVNNVILFIDKAVIGPETDLSIYRNLSGLVGLSLLLYGLIWEAE